MSEGFADVREFPEGTRTAAEAAAAVGCDIAQIVKSLVFLRDDAAVLVLCSGANTVDAERFGLAKADADFVYRTSGYRIGGVAPYGWVTPPADTLLDEDLMSHDELWAAAGRPNVVFPLTPAQLSERSGGRVTRVKP